ncbi:MAG: thioredoxin domain-containing protein [Flavobacteriaceae bacterium]|nr:thioredoxin domain-containing protein [Flavobacteriaceae bacterium]
MISPSSNRLAKASSPYLLQHKNNPVDWYEWGEEALQKAKEENKPLLISVGYAACHWCHVMAHESFEDEDVAKLMNQYFICIKVDREERPDIDQIYMDAAQILTGRGGWPLNAFALPDGRPFYAATYFPKANWKKVLANVHQAFTSQLDQLEDTAQKLTEGIQIGDLAEFEPAALKLFSTSDYKDLLVSWMKFSDLEKGGFKGAPKFPMPNSWEFLLQYYAITKNESALEAVVVTLNEMAKGGIYDQIGGGFARYSVDDVWLVPHFEKMLYDNAQLISLYAQAHRLFPNPFYQSVISETIDFVNRELKGDSPGFYASLDADSEEEEGKYYVWEYEEIKNEIQPTDWAWFKDFYQLQPQGNWEEGKNILHLPHLPKKFAVKNSINFEELNTKVFNYKKQLHQLRWNRIHPDLDDKILNSWNALMLKALVEASKSLQHLNYLNQAKELADFIYANLRTSSGHLKRNFKNDKASIDAFLEDYALLSEGLISLYQLSFEKQYLDWAYALTDICIEEFYDENSGMFFFTSSKGEQLIARKMELNDNVIPASNSVMAKVLFLLGHFYAEDEKIEMSKKMLSQVEKKLFKSGPYFANWSQLAGWLAYPLNEVAVLGEHAFEVNFKMQQTYFPNAIFLGGKEENLALLKGKLKRGETTIYVCKNKTCQQPTNSVEVALSQLLQAFK